MAHYLVVLTTQDGVRHVLARTRRHPGAVNERNLAVESKSAQLRSHVGGGRVVEGPTGEGDTVAVMLLDRAIGLDGGLYDVDIIYRYSVELDTPHPVR